MNYTEIFLKREILSLLLLTFCKLPAGENEQRRVTEVNDIFGEYLDKFKGIYVGDKGRGPVDVT